MCENEKLKLIDDMQDILQHRQKLIIRELEWAALELWDLKKKVEDQIEEQLRIQNKNQKEEVANECR